MEIKQFFSTLILCEISFGWFENVKSCHFQPFWRLWIWFLEKSHLKMSTISKYSKFRATEIVKMAGFGVSKWTELIWRKNWAAEKSWNFPTMHNHSFKFHWLLYFTSNHLNNYSWNQFDFNSVGFTEVLGTIHGKISETDNCRIFHTLT